MDVPISLGVILALGMSVMETANHAKDAYYNSAIMLLFFLLVGRALDHAMRRKTRAVAGNLAALKAETAHRFSGDELISVPVAALNAGDRLLVKPGERVPADGQVLGGASEIDDSLITGETARRKVGAGATVYAGSLNYSGALTMRVTAADRATLLDEIERLLEQAASAKSRAIRLADRAARFYAPMVHLTAAATFAGWWLAGASLHDAVVTAIAVLIITCPCALALAIPAVQVVASGALFRAGVILNAGDAIERLGEADTVVFDKTGTLTLPEPRVVNADAIDPDLLQMAARLALSSRHPLAQALARESASHVPYDVVTEEPGQGVRAMFGGIEARLGSAAFCGHPSTPLIPAQAGIQSAGHKNEIHLPWAPASAGTNGEMGEAGDSHIYFVYGSRAATIAIAQKLRPDAAEVVQALRKRGLDIAHPVRRPRRRGAAGGRDLGHRQMAGRCEAGGENRLHRRVETAGPPRADGRRRPQRRAGARCRDRLAVADRRRRRDAGASRRGVSRRAAQAGARCHHGRPPCPWIDETEPVVCRDLQYDRGAGRHCGRDHAVDRRARHVGLVDDGDAERVARRQGHMNVLVYLVPMALGLGLIGLAGFLWALRSGQYSDVEGAALRMLSDDDIEKRTRRIGFANRLTHPTPASPSRNPPAARSPAPRNRRNSRARCA